VTISFQEGLCSTELVSKQIQEDHTNNATTVEVQHCYAVYISYMQISDE